MATEQHSIVRIGKSKVEMTNNKSLRSRHCIMLKLQIDTKHRAASLRQQSYLLVVTAI